MREFSELKFVRTFDFEHIPRPLFEQVKEMDAGMIDRLYQYGPLMVGPLTLLYVLIDEVHKIKGVLWADIDIIEANIHVHLFSVDKEYQNGEALKKATEFLLNLPTGQDLKKRLNMLTTRPKAFEEIGWKHSKRIRMEIENVEAPKITEPDNTD